MLVFQIGTSSRKCYPMSETVWSAGHILEVTATVRSLPLNKGVTSHLTAVCSKWWGTSNWKPERPIVTSYSSFYVVFLLLTFLIFVRRVQRTRAFKMPDADAFISPLMFFFRSVKLIIGGLKGSNRARWGTKPGEVTIVFTMKDRQHYEASTCERRSTDIYKTFPEISAPGDVVGVWSTHDPSLSWRSEDIWRQVDTDWQYAFVVGVTYWTRYNLSLISCA